VMISNERIGKQGTWLSAIALLLSPLIIIFSFRWVLYEPFVIPSSSMEPTLLINDHIFVNKFVYGVRSPFVKNGWLFNWNTPKRGDVIVFKYPKNPKVFYIKRLIGIPGDQVKIISGQISVNDEPWVLRPLDQFYDDKGDPVSDEFQYAGESVPDYEALEKFKNSGTLNKTQDELKKLSQKEIQKKIEEKIKNENLSSVARFERSEHFVKRNKNEEGADNSVKEFVVPKNTYFVMGDNRDQSSDSRSWGFVDHNLLVGRASIIWLSCEKTLETAPMFCDPAMFRLPRFFKKVL
jgi:signal peptidase I